MAKTENARRLFGAEFKPMLAKSFETSKIAYPVAIEPKLDGLRTVAIIRDGGAVFVSRNGLAFPALNHCAEFFAAHAASNGFDNVAIDCEVTAGDFHETSGAVRRLDEAAQGATFHLFDIVPAPFILGERKGFPDSYAKRRETLARLMRGAPDFMRLVESRVARSADDIGAAYRDFRAQGFEGAMVKDIAAPYARGRNGAWLKMKECESFDMRVLGVFEGAGKFAGTLGGLVCDLDGVTVEIGTGFTNEIRDSIWANPALYIGRMVEATAQEKTPSGSLRHPRFYRWRDDKAA